MQIPRPLLIREHPAGFDLLLSYVQGKDMSPYEGRSGIAAMHLFATLHATFWGIDPSKAREINAYGGYWSLSAQASHHDLMTPDGLLGRLKRASVALDMWLAAADGRTIVHGDAKRDNLKFAASCAPCTSTTASEPCTAGVRLCVARMIDFQWAGVGHYMRDLAHLLHLNTDPVLEAQMLAHYTLALSQTLRAWGITPPSFEHVLVAMEVASADLFRWKSAKNPGLAYRVRMEARTAALLDQLDGRIKLRGRRAYVRRLFRLFPQSPFVEGQPAQLRLVRAALNGSEAWSGELSADEWRSIGVPDLAALKA
jgi:hypothetical protein